MPLQHSVGNPCHPLVKAGAQSLSPRGRVTRSHMQATNAYSPGPAAQMLTWRTLLLYKCLGTPAGPVGSMGPSPRQRWQSEQGEAGAPATLWLRVEGATQACRTPSWVPGYGIPKWRFKSLCRSAIKLLNQQTLAPSPSPCPDIILTTVPAALAPSL